MYVTSNNIREPTTHSVSMKPIKCPYESCKKEFEKPIVVINFSFVPKKETYYACPYCLTKVGTITKDRDLKPVTVEKLVDTENEKLEEKSEEQPENFAIPKRAREYSMGPQTIAMEKLESLEKEKADLQAELEELRKKAETKAGCLEEEVEQLREEAEALKKLTEK